ncbi:MAG: hypothetical protein ABSH06_24645 [Thermodesulfobacteriota bacterium]|jgi:hypothetical protein
MLDLIELNKRFDRAFDKKQAKVLAEVFFGAYSDLVKASDFNELKTIIKDLAEAQKRTEIELRELVGEHRKTRTQLGGLSMTIGYTLEDKAFKALPALLKKDYGLIVKEKLKRKFVTDNKGQPVEVNIIGQADQNGQTSVIVGEAKSQLSKNDIDAFMRKKLNRLKGIYDRIFPILITYMISEPDVEEYAKGKGIILYYSYDLES